MKLVRDARSLKAKALGSLRRGLSAFNSYEEDGRTTTVLLHLQHACEMLLKAALVQKQVKIFDKQTSTSFGFAKCLNLAQANCGVADEQAGAMRAIDALRDAEQHWLLVVSEQLLYMHCRALVTVVDEILKGSFDDALAYHLPLRVLPVSTTPPANIDVLLDREFTQINELLTPRRRARDEARGRIRALLAMEAHVVEEVAVSEKDIDRIENAIRVGNAFGAVFPRLTSLGTSIEGEGIEVKVHFTKRQGAPVRFVAADNPEEAAAVRELDLRKKYHLSRRDLAKSLGLSEPKAAALRRHLRLDQNTDYCHVFEFGKTKFPYFSDNALGVMRQALPQMDEIWRITREKG
ncbi:hypothetical protein [Rhodomicrobium vannielii]|nr:hypothetical protein [Rhodomicrobium vannielii]